LEIFFNLCAVTIGSEMIFHFTKYFENLTTTTPRTRTFVSLVKGKGKDVDLYSAFHAPGTPNALTSLKLTCQTAI